MAANRYAEYAEAYQSAREGKEIHLSTCYTAKWDGRTRGVYEDVSKHAGDSEYLTNQASHYRSLSEQEQRKAAAGRARSGVGEKTERERQ